MIPKPITQTVDGKRYNSATATLIASDTWWHRDCYHRGNSTIFLYRSRAGRYFALHCDGPRVGFESPEDYEWIEPLEPDQALELYHDMAAHGTARIPAEKAFPRMTPAQRETPPLKYAVQHTGRAFDSGKPIPESAWRPYSEHTSVATAIRYYHTALLDWDDQFRIGFCETETTHAQEDADAAGNRM